MHPNAFAAGALLQTLLGELTALLRTPSWIQEAYAHGEWRKRAVRGRGRHGRGVEGRGRGEEGGVTG